MDIIIYYILSISHPLEVCIYGTFTRIWDKEYYVETKLYLLAGGGKY